MSYSSSKHSKTSAYQVYSSQSKKSSSNSSRHGGKSFESEDGDHQQHGSFKKSSGGWRDKGKDKKHSREKLYDSDDEVLKVSQPKSLLSLPLPSDGKSGRPFSSSPHKVIKRHGKTAQSLLDMDFNKEHRRASQKKTASNSSDDDAADEGKSNADSRRDFSDSEEDDEDGRHLSEKVDKEKRSWKESSKYSSSPSMLSPLVVEMSRPSGSGAEANMSPEPDKGPMSLLDMPLAKRMPVSLMDLSRGMDSFGRNSQGYKTGRESYKKSSHSSLDVDRSRGDRRRESGPRKRKDTYDDERDQGSKRKKMNSEKTFSTSVSNRIVACSDSKQSFLLIPSACPTVGIHGRASFTLLMGSVTVLGYQLKIGQSYPVFSPLTGGLLSLHAGGEKLKWEDVKAELSSHGFSGLDPSLEAVGNSTIAVLLVSKLESVLCDYITTIIPYTQLFNPVPHKEEYHSMGQGATLPKIGLKVAPHNEMVPTCLNMSSDYQDILDRWRKLIEQQDDQPPVVLCCGAKNTGKSTFSRMLINAALQSVQSVAYLECDIGQTEFSPPATLSLHIITEPVLGPPFCHQRHAERLVFYGDVTPSTDPSMYIKCLSYAYKAYTELSQPLPLVVNTMGYSEDLGVLLLLDTVNMTKPDMVVQIDSYNQVTNLPAITHEMVALQPGWTYNKSPSHMSHDVVVSPMAQAHMFPWFSSQTPIPPDLVIHCGGDSDQIEDPKQKMTETHKHELILLMTLAGQRRDVSVKLKPVDLRNLSLLSSLSLGLDRSMMLNSLPPYTVPYARLAFHICHHSVPASELVTAVDASVVALCVADVSQLTKESEELPYMFEEMPVCECLGLGIIRGVDTSKGLLYVVTTLPAVRLRRVNTVLKGSLTLPDQLIFKQKSSRAVPYVDALAPSTGFSALRTRSRMPRNTRRNN